MLEGVVVACESLRVSVLSSSHLIILSSRSDLRGAPRAACIWEQVVEQQVREGTENR